MDDSLDSSYNCLGNYKEISQGYEHYCDTHKPHLNCGMCENCSKRKHRDVTNDVMKRHHDVTRRCFPAIPKWNVSWIIVFLFIIISQFSTSLCCILLLDGWQPVSIESRAQLADVIITGRVLRTFKTQRTEANTYVAEFYVVHVIKGRDVIEQLPGRGHYGNVYNVSNFGDRVMCYADVDASQTYLLFLTLYQNALSAKYDDIFGAAEDFSIDKEDRALDATGWPPWGEWSQCSTTCGGGIQRRTRVCSGCDGGVIQTRDCNYISCYDATDLLKLWEIPQVNQTDTIEDPRGFPINYDVTRKIPADELFHGLYPEEFSILISVKMDNNTKGYIFIITDEQNDVYFSVRLGDIVGISFNNAKQEISRENAEMASLELESNIADQKWHSLSISVTEKVLTIWIDCDIIYNEPVTENTEFSFPPGGYITMGLPPKLTNFRGIAEQVTITSDPSGAAKHCSVDVKPQVDTLFEERSTSNVPGPAVIQSTVSPSDEVTWSEWSRCSATCGKGVQRRRAICSSGHLAALCAVALQKRSETRMCNQAKCPGKCRRTCLNGGKCDVTSGRCQCPSGYHGRRCHKAICQPKCQNGGKCASPGNCVCRAGYHGNSCQDVQCSPGCENGGVCVKPNKCACPYGYSAKSCKPRCSGGCQHGGSCVIDEICRCPQGYVGKNCEIPICSNGCQNGGICVSPEVCHCPPGFRGRDCSTPNCSPECLNGGTCVSPYRCNCKPNYYGHLCQYEFCNTVCLNGGRCVRKGRCICAVGYYGNHCQHAFCSLRCQNGGICIQPNTCICQNGFTGHDCSYRTDGGRWYGPRNGKPRVITLFSIRPRRTRVRTFTERSARGLAVIK